jgi:hypothetical protein
LCYKHLNKAFFAQLADAMKIKRIRKREENKNKI